MTRQAIPILSLLAVLTPSGVAWADEPRRIWILPFEQLQADSSVEHLREALPALLAVAFSQSDDHIVVDREHLNELLEELSLTLEGLVETDDRRRIGRLLGATVMITGSFVQQDGNLLVTSRATDLQTGVVTGTSSVRGRTRQLAELVRDLHRAVATTFGKPLPDFSSDHIDRAPLSNLHFMKGLAHYFSARYRHALAEFMLASDGDELDDTSRLWLANAYMADRQYSHAYLELVALAHRGSGSVNAVAVRMRECEKHLNADDVKRIRDLAVRQRPSRRSGGRCHHC